MTLTAGKRDGNAVLDLFERKANTYRQRSDAFPWRAIRAAEARAVAAMLGPVDGKTALDLGCGAGFYTRLLLERGAAHVTAVDFSPAMVSALPRSGVRGIVADALSLRLSDKFPCIVSAGLLEFVSDPLGVFASARHHADRDTVFVLLAPSQTLLGQVYRAFHRANGLSIRLYSRYELTDLAARSGWRVARYRTVLPFAQVARLELARTP